MVSASDCPHGREGVPDATLVVAVRRHPVFTRNGADLSRELPVTLGEALLGGEVPVETLAGKTLLLRVPEGTQHGRTFRLTGQGLPRFREDGRGDLYVKVRLVLPTGLDDEAKVACPHLHRPHRTARPTPWSAHHGRPHRLTDTTAARPSRRVSPEEHPTMKLDRYTEKAQEAIVAAQRLATDADSPVLDVEHLLAALLQDPEGIPAVTLRALGADPSAISLELAGVLSRRARVSGGQLSLEPRARRMLEHAENEAKRLNDDYVRGPARLRELLATNAP